MHRNWRDWCVLAYYAGFLALGVAAVDVDNGLDADDDGAGLEVDRRQPLRLAERKERVRHQVLRVARREIARQRPEEIELLAFTSVMARRHPLAAQRCGAWLPAAPVGS